jgi:glycosyltransferase involved in cell wall biosynthesis
MDLYPESALAKVPSWVRPIVAGPLRCLDRINAQSATKLVVISERMRQIYERDRRLPSARLVVVPTWQDESLFLNLPKRTAASRHYNVAPDLFTFVYAGNIGPVAGVEHLIRSFAMAGLAQSQLVVGGQGTRKEACVELARRSPASIRFLSDPDVGNVPLMQALADVCLLPARRGAALCSIPSKLSAYMLSAKPVLASVDAESDSAALIRQADCGWVIEPEQPEVMAQMMRKVARCDPTQLAATGRRGRSYALAHLGSTQSVNNLAATILAAAAPNRDHASGQNNPLSADAAENLSP